MHDLTASLTVHNDMIEQVLERLRSNGDQTLARRRKALRLRGSYRDKYRETVEALAERMLDILRLNEHAASPEPHDDNEPAIEEPVAPAAAKHDVESTDVTIPHHSLEERSERRPLITLKGDVAISGRAALYAQRQGVQVQVIKRRVPSAPQVTPARPSDLSASQAQRRTYKQEMEALYWPSLSERKPQADSRVNWTAARSELLPTSTQIQRQPKHTEHPQPPKHPTPAVRVEPVAPPPPPEHRDGRIHFEYDDTVRRLAEPLRKAIKQVGIKRYGILTCFEVITDMLGYDGYNDFMDRFEDFPPSPTDLQASPEERVRRYRQYCAALEKHGLSPEQAKEAIKLSRKGEWFGLDEVEEMVQEEADGKADRAAQSADASPTTAPSKNAPRQASMSDGSDGAMEVMGFANLNIAFSVGKKIRNALRKRGMECSLDLGREYAARMFGYRNLNDLLRSCHTRPRSLPDDKVCEGDQAARLSQYANVLIAQGMSRSHAIDVLRDCRISGWLAFWGRE